MNRLVCGLGLSLAVLSCATGDVSSFGDGDGGDGHSAGGAASGGSDGASSSQGGNGVGAGGVGGGAVGGGAVGGGGVGGGGNSCAPGAVLPCYSGAPATQGVGSCMAGTETCGSDGTWGPCEGEVLPATEQCNGVDDDCDAVVDNGCNCVDGNQQSCYDGPAGTLDVGECQGGNQTCQGGQWGPCQGEVLPLNEACDGLDNDCNGISDEGNPGGGGACNTGLLGICAAGTLNCSNGSLGCQQLSTPGAEVCDAQDNNCDGMVDEGNPGGGAACNTGMPGVCAAGTVTCSGGALGCQQTTSAGTEICPDGLDNDCNGVVDDCALGCSHDKCTTGGALVNGCDPCVSQICAVDAYCCNTAWDSICVGEVTSVCGLPCVGGGCSHPICQTGGALVSGCDAQGCVSTICGVDPFCCDTSWDSICVGEVATECGLSCP